MSESDQNQGLEPEFQEELSQQAHSLVEHIERGDYTGALDIVSELNNTRDRTLYLEVGKLTRSLHEAIRNFQIDVGQDGQVRKDLSEITDASDRLSYVVEMTNKAANKTMDLVEDSMPVATSIKDEAKVLKEAWERLRRREMEPEEFRQLYRRIDVFFDDLTKNSEQVYTNLSNILMAQDYQDLTGQVIQKVTRLVKDVEDNLVKLVVMAGKVDSITGTQHDLEQKEEEKDDSKGFGPQMKVEERTDVVSGQDDVDDLLSSLGF